MSENAPQHRSYNQRPSSVTSVRTGDTFSPGGAMGAPTRVPGTATGEGFGAYA